MARRERSLRSVAEELADEIRALPFPPASAAIQEQADNATEPAFQAIMRAAREVLGTPAAAWEADELLAMTLAEFSPELQAVLEHRLEQRWNALHAVVRQLRSAGAVDSTIDDNAAVLHVLAVGLGLAMLEPVAPHWSAASDWAALSARLLESLAAIDPQLDDGDGSHVTWRARITLTNNPAGLARVLRVLALMRVNVLTMLTAPIDDGRQLVDFVLRVPWNIERATLMQALESVANHVIVARGEVTDADDIATRVLSLSTALVRHPEAAPQAAADLVLADSFEVVDATQGPDASPHVLRLQWTVEKHVVVRREAPFTHAEFIRASALLALVEALSQARGASESFGWSETLADGSRMWIRLGRPEDADPVADMHARCSQDSIYQRYFTPMNSWREENLRRISGGHRGATLVATIEGGTVVALGNIFPLGSDDADTGEIAVIVEDAWQNRGIGRRMLEHLVELAPRLGFARIDAYVLAQNTSMVRLLRRLPVEWETMADHDLGASITCLRADVGERVTNRHEFGL
jgi:RimJ/RimL family protein N-acetyltransferase